jgi:hypothetical protein
MHRRLSTLLVCLALAIGTFALLAPSAGAGGGLVEPTVTGTSTCGVDGNITITWTFSYGGSSGPTVDVSSGGTLSGAATGTVTFSPQQFPATGPSNPATSTGTSVLPGTTNGVVNIQVGWGLVGGGGGAVQGAITLDGTCAAPQAIVAPARFTG